MSKTMIIVLTAILACSIYGGQEALSMDLNQFRWKNRLILMFTPNESDPSFQALQNEISTQPDEISERDLVVFRIFEPGPSYQAIKQLDPQTHFFESTHN